MSFLRTLRAGRRNSYLRTVKEKKAGEERENNGTKALPSFLLLSVLCCNSEITANPIIVLSADRALRRTINYSAMSEEEDPMAAAVCEFFAKCFLTLEPPDSLSELSDGVVMFQALSEM